MVEVGGVQLHEEFCRSNHLSYMLKALTRARLATAAREVAIRHNKLGSPTRARMATSNRGSTATNVFDRFEDRDGGGVIFHVKNGLEEYRPELHIYYYIGVT